MKLIIKVVLVSLVVSLVSIFSFDATRSIYIPNENAGAYGYSPSKNEDYVLIKGTEFVQYYLGHYQRFFQSRGRDFLSIFLAAMASAMIFHFFIKRHENT